MFEKQLLFLQNQFDSMEGELFPLINAVPLLAMQAPMGRCVAPTHS
jgi:hypothetical protein